LNLIRVSRVRCLLLDLLIARGMTRAEYARRSGRNKRMIYHFCDNTRTMLPEDQYLASLILGCDMQDLYEYKVTEMANKI